MEFEGDAISRGVGCALSRFDAIPEKDAMENLDLAEVDAKFGKGRPRERRREHLTWSCLRVRVVENFSWEKGGGCNNKRRFAVAVRRLPERKAIASAAIIKGNHGAEKIPIERQPPRS